MGLLINPYFPENVTFIANHLLPKIGESTTQVGNEWTAYRTETLVNNSGMALAAVIGGVLALGCTIGQGVTGMSTLALGSLLTLLSIIFGSALTMKIQYHRLDNMTFLCALRQSLIEMKLFPAARQSG